MKFSIENLVFESTNLSEAWRWRQTMELLLSGPLSEKSDAQKCSYFLLYIGQRGRDIFNTWPETDEQTVNDLFTKFAAYCMPRNIVILSRYRFGKRNQQPGELIDEYVTELTRLAADCNYGTLKKELRDRMIIGCLDGSITEKLLQEEGIDLDKAIQTARSIEISKRQLSEMMRNETSSVNAIQSSAAERTRSNCNRCGRYHSVKTQCPALGKTCNFCSKTGHFESVCFKKKNSTRRAKSVHAMSSYSNAASVEEQKEESWKDNGEQTFFLSSIDNKADEALVNITVNDNATVRFKLDTGAQVNVIPENVFKTIAPPLPLLSTESITLRSYSGNKLPVLGRCTLSCAYHDKKLNAEFFVVAQASCPVLGLRSCLDLNLIMLIFDVQKDVKSTENILTCYDDVFQGIGRFPGTYNIRLKDDVHPVVRSCREYPISIRDKVKAALDERVKNEIIVRVDQPTDWVHLAHPVPKDDGSYRIVLEPRDLNKNICCEHFYIPTLNDITWRLES